MLRDRPISLEPAGPEPQSSTPGRAPAPETWTDAPEWPADDDAEVARASCPRSASHGPEARAAEVSPPCDTRRHREVLAITCIVGVLAFALVEVPEGRVALRGLRQYPLPQSCVTRSVLGLKCPGCGLTRSIIHLAEGDWQASWRCHRLGAIMAAVLIFQIPYRLLALRRPDCLLIPPRWQGVMGGVLIALLFANWLADVVAGRLGPL